MIKTLPKLRVSNNLTCFPIPSEMTNLSSATLTIGGTRTAEVQKCHFCLQVGFKCTLPMVTIDDYDAWYIAVESCDYDEVPVFHLPEEEYK